MFPLVAYALDAPALGVITTAIPDLPRAIDIVKEVTHEEYNIGHSLWRSQLQLLVEGNPHVFTYQETGPLGLQKEDLAELGTVVSLFGAPFYKQKAFGLIDICGFSKLDYAGQLSHLYSLATMAESASKRCARFCSQLNVAPAFSRSSTGDGFYVWHEAVGGNADVAVFMLLMCVMAQTEAMRAEGFPMRLRAGYVIDSAFFFYDDRAIDGPFEASNAVGPATNGASRLLEAALPSQVLIQNFSRPGRGDEVMTVKSLLQQAEKLFAIEPHHLPAKLSVSPDEILRVVDKHGEAWYCWNLAGTAPNTFGTKTAMQPIGIYEDTAPDIRGMAFRHDP